MTIGIFNEWIVKYFFVHKIVFKAILVCFMLNVLTLGNKWGEVGLNWYKSSLRFDSRIIFCSVSSDVQTGETEPKISSEVKFQRDVHPSCSTLGAILAFTSFSPPVLEEHNLKSKQFQYQVFTYSVNIQLFAMLSILNNECNILILIQCWKTIVYIISYMFNTTFKNISVISW